MFTFRASPAVNVCVCTYNMYTKCVCVCICIPYTYTVSMCVGIPHDAPVQDGGRLVAWVARPQLLVYDAFVQGARVKGVIAQVQVAFAVEEHQHLDAIRLTQLQLSEILISQCPSILSSIKSLYKGLLRIWRPSAQRRRRPRSGQQGPSCEPPRRGARA